ncbi:hypothetical protein KIN20_003508 [Parelaphostrongylus tenuis]|uniref:DNA helicase Pif1-like 2B domain-containing protein n=1 Tax=Parelaphostrongylus tenuis TaxID=148309 RepID=A0AAD5QIN2_PARTN|nr:hypothetical protein KIN20_003508 [Parelaphostrongylus tenuis]
MVVEQEPGRAVVSTRPRKGENAVLFPVARHIRGDNLPFGGIKLIITGDFLQLPPIGERNSAYPAGGLMPKTDSLFPIQYSSAIAERLVLNASTQVMLLKNIDLSRGLSNGSRGVVARFSKNGFPVVKFLSNQEEVEISPVRFSVRIPGLQEPGL